MTAGTNVLCKEKMKVLITMEIYYDISVHVELLKEPLQVKGAHCTLLTSILKVGQAHMKFVLNTDRRCNSVWDRLF